MLHFIAPVYHGHEYGFVGLFAGSTGNVRKSGGQVYEDVPENAFRHVDEAGHTVHGHRLRQVRLRCTAEDEKVVAHLGEVRLQCHRG